MRGVSRILENKEILSAHLLPPVREVEQIVKSRWQVRRAAAEVRRAQERERHEEVIAHLAGPVPGARLSSLGDTGTATREAARRVRALLDERLGPRSHNFQTTEP